MSFQSAQAAAVFEEYEQRRHEETKRMAALGPDAGMAKRDEFLLPVGPEAAWFLHSLIVATRPSLILELGTSYGYSTLFLADAARQVGGRVISMELAQDKQLYAAQKLDDAGLAEVVDLVQGDAVEQIGHIDAPLDFVLVDIWKELYVPCFKAFYPKLAPRGIIAADNMIFPPQARDDVRKFRQLIKETPDLSSTLLTVGSGIELACRWPQNHPDL